MQAAQRFRPDVQCRDGAGPEYLFGHPERVGRLLRAKPHQAIRRDAPIAETERVWDFVRNAFRSHATIERCAGRLARDFAPPCDPLKTE